jgi:carboxylesterase
VTEPTPRPGAEAFRFPGGRDGILMIHGFSGSPASLRPLGEWFAEQGVSVMGVRLPGHGTSVEDFQRRRWPEWVAATEEGLDELRGSTDRIVVFAQSFGAALAVHLAATREADVHGLALTSPYLFDGRLAFLPVARLVVKEKKGVGDDVHMEHRAETAYDRIPADAIATMAAFLKIARGDLPKVRAPALVFRPGEDHTIPRGNPDKVYGRLGSSRKELLDCPNSYHVISLDHDAPMVRERVLALLRSL